MSLHYIIDGYNLLKHRALETSVKTHDITLRIVNVIRTRQLCGSLKNQVTLVFDGYSGMHNSGQSSQGIVAVFSGDQSADDLIKQMVEQAANPKIIVVVSDDRQIRDYIKSAGAVSKGIEDFLLRDNVAPVPKHTGDSKPELTAEMQYRINQELRQKWLK